MPSLIGRGPGQYLLACENRSAFDAFKATLDEELRPTDAIERIWVDEFVDLEWDLHRLRITRRTVVEQALTNRLAEKAGNILARFPMRDEDVPVSVAEIRYRALACVRGVPEHINFMSDALGRLNMNDELMIAQAETAETLARLEQSIEATSRLRDAVLSRLYARRDLIADGRIVSGRGR